MSKIVVADDDQDMLSLIQNTLQFRGHEVVTARDGQQAWQMILSEKPDALILDVNMPVINGFEVCRRVKADPRTRHVAVMFLTAREDVSDKVTGFEVGGDDYLVKPFQPRELSARVSVLLKRAEGNRPTDTAEDVSGRVISLFGAKGGMGTSVIAANLATSLALSGNSVALIDLDLEHAISAMLFDVVPRRIGTIVDLSSGFDPTMDWSHLDGFMVPHKSGVKILPGPNSPVHAELVTGEHIRNYVSLLRRHNSFVIIDMASTFRDVNLDAFELSDLLILAVTPELPALKAFHGLTEVMVQLGVPSNIIQVVVNQTTPTASLSTEDVKRAVGLPLIGAIPFGGEELVSAVNQGIPIVQMRPQHPVSLAMKKLTEAVVSMGSPESQPSVRK